MPSPMQETKKRHKRTYRVVDIYTISMESLAVFILSSCLLSQLTLIIG